jgi:hypothetical protein
MSSDINPIRGPSDIQYEKLVPVKKPLKTKFQETVEKIKKVLALIKEKIWALPSEAAKFVGSVLRIVASGEEVASSVSNVSTNVAHAALHVHRAIAVLGALAFANMLINFLHIPFRVHDAVEDKKIDDTEGVIRNATGAVISATEVVYDMSLGVAALTAAGAIPFIAAFSFIVLPLAIVLLTYATAKGIYDIAQRGRFLHSIPLPLPENANGIEILKKYLDKKLGVTVVESKITFSAKKINILERRSDVQIVKLMKKMRKHLENEKPDIKKANEALIHMKKFIWRKISLDSVGVVVNLALLASLVASAVLPALAVIVIPVVAGVKSAVSIARIGFDFGLTHWHKKNVPVFSVITTPA